VGHFPHAGDVLARVAVQDHEARVREHRGEERDPQRIPRRLLQQAPPPRPLARRKLDVHALVAIDSGRQPGSSHSQGSRINLGGVFRVGSFTEECAVKIS